MSRDDESYRTGLPVLININLPVSEFSTQQALLNRDAGHVVSGSMWINPTTPGTFYALELSGAGLFSWTGNGVLWTAVSIGGGGAGIISINAQLGPPILVTPGVGIAVSNPIPNTVQIDNTAPAIPAITDVNAQTGPSLLVTAGVGIAVSNPIPNTIQIDNTGAAPQPSNALQVSPAFVGLVGPVFFEKVQDAITAAVAGQCVKIWPGTYVEHVTLKNGVDLEGCGVDTTIITEGATPGPTVQDDPAVDTVCQVTNLTIENSGATNVTLLVQRAGTNLTFSTLSISQTDIILGWSAIQVNAGSVLNGTNSTRVVSALSDGLDLGPGSIGRNFQLEGAVGSNALYVDVGALAENCICRGRMFAEGTLRNCNTVSVDPALQAMTVTSTGLAEFCVALSETSVGIRNLGIIRKCIGQSNGAFDGIDNDGGEAVQCIGQSATGIGFENHTVSTATQCRGESGATFGFLNDGSTADECSGSSTAGVGFKNFAGNATSCDGVGVTVGFQNLNGSQAKKCTGSDSGGGDGFVNGIIGGDSSIAILCSGIGAGIGFIALTGTFNEGCCGIASGGGIGLRVAGALAVNCVGSGVPGNPPAPGIDLQNAFMLGGPNNPAQLIGCKSPDGGGVDVSGDNNIIRGGEYVGNPCINMISDNTGLAPPVGLVVLNPTLGPGVAIDCLTFAAVYTVAFGGMIGGNSALAPVNPPVQAFVSVQDVQGNLLGPP